MSKPKKSDYEPSALSVDVGDEFKLVPVAEDAPPAKTIEQMLAEVRAKNGAPAPQQ